VIAERFESPAALETIIAGIDSKIDEDIVWSKEIEIPNDLIKALWGIDLSEPEEKVYIDSIKIIDL
jgi:hypothetical protein